MAHAPTAPAPPDPNPPDLDATVMDVLPLASSGGNSLALAIALANEAQNLYCSNEIGTATKL